jgi:hypothetical protein
MESIKDFFGNKKVQLAGALLLFGLFIVLLSIGVNMNHQTATYSSRASEEEVYMNIFFDTEEISTEPYISNTVMVKAQPSTGSQLIQGYRFVLSFDPQLMKVIDMRYKLGNSSVGMGDNADTLIKVNEKGELVLQAEEHSPSGISIDSNSQYDLVELKIITVADEDTTIKLKEGSFNNFISIAEDGSLNTLPIKYKADEEKEDNEEERGLLVQSSKLPEEMPDINLKVKLQGVTDSVTKSNMPFTLFATIPQEDAEDKEKNIFGNLSQINKVGDNMWEGSLKLPLQKNVGYKFSLNINRHISTMICDATPTEEEPGSYFCENRGVSITEFPFTLDTTNILVLTGDLPEQNGIIDSEDITKVKTFIGRSDVDANYHADLNYDGIVDTQDHGLVITALEKYKYRPGDGNESSSGYSSNLNQSATESGTMSPELETGESTASPEAGEFVEEDPASLPVSE